MLSGKYKKLTNEEQEFLKSWLDRLPTVESHYCRSAVAYQSKKFLYPGATIRQLHRDYSKAAEEAQNRPVSFPTFCGIFHKENYSVFIPRKDQCDACVSFKYGNISQEEYVEHCRLKDEARSEKKKDTESVSEKKSVWTMDLQAVLLCPRSKASSMYYKTKLQVHNFTLFEASSKDGYCYVWNESEGDLSSEVFAYLQYSHFEKVLKKDTRIEEIVIWSDGCGYQNRNTTVSNAFSALAREYKVTITQKYLVAGHTQMECDSMHSVIERNISADVFTERDYVVVMEHARKKPSPYHVTSLKHENFHKMDKLFFNSIRPGKKPGDATVHSLRGLQYKADGNVHFKLSFSEDTDWQLLPQRIQALQEWEWIPLFPAQLPITLRKYQDLQSMKKVMPVDCHHFFDSLPHV